MASIASVALLSGCSGKTEIDGEESPNGAQSGGASASGGTGGWSASGGTGGARVQQDAQVGGNSANIGAGGGFPGPMPTPAPADILGCAGGDVVNLSPSIVATRLAAFIYQSGPDAELLAAANGGALSTKAGVACQARRMLGTPQAAQGVKALFRSWLGYSPTKQPLGTTYQDYAVDDATYARMVDETDRFVKDVFFSPGSSFSDLLTASYTFLDPELAAHYDIPYPFNQPGPLKVSPPAGRERSGVLTQGLVLESASGTVYISRRGRWISTHLRCVLVPPEPLGAARIPRSATLSSRNLLIQNVSDPVCMSCHALADPLGYGLEYFDGTGRFRSNDNGFFIDASGSLPNSDGNAPSEFIGAQGLGQALSNDSAALSCAGNQVLTHALKLFVVPNPTIGPADIPKTTLASMRAVFEGTGKNMKELVIAAVTTPEFLAP